MMVGAHLKLAWQTIKRTKWRSIFTSVGIVIGVVSVLMTISLGAGVKHEVKNQIKAYGSDLLLVRPGQNIRRDQSGAIIGGNLLSDTSSAGTLSDNDVETISNVPGVETVLPMGIVNGLASYDGTTYNDGTVVATTSVLPDILNHKVVYGEFFTSTDEGRNFAVIGKDVARQLFKENIPIGKSLDFRSQSYVVKGVFDTFKTTPFSPTTNYNQTIFIPYTTGKAVNQGSVPLYQILVKPTNPALAKAVQEQATESLLKAHGGQADFAVLNQSDTLALTSNTLRLITSLIAAIAAVALLVGGVGVMNIMIASVTERTHEIGVRKAVGATDGQIMGQFLAEAILLSAVGGISGIVITLVAIGLMDLFSSLHPLISPLTILLALLVAIAIGVIFGVAPALKAARKDPITALRRG
jgi:ABC-type antimicrobial peptide transport system permease subunit